MVRVSRLLRLPVAALLLLFFVEGPSVWAECDIQLNLNGANSPFALSGSANATNFLNGLALEPKEEGQVVGLIGSLVLSSEEDCPEKPSELNKFLKSAKFVAGESPLVLYPDGIQLLVDPNIAELTFADVEMELTSQELTVKEDVAQGRFNMTITKGRVDYVVILELGDLNIPPGNASVVGRTSSAELTATFDLDGDLNVTMEDVRFNFDVAFETGFDAVPEISTRLNLVGRLEGSGGQGCVDCGENGRCVSGSDGKGVCQCACGWAGEDCSVPNGFCERFGDVGNATPLRRESCKTELDTEESLEERCSELLSARQCFDSRSRFDTNTQKCECLPDWEGKDCEMCTANDVCDDFLGVVGAACRYDYEYDPRTALKLYECNLAGTSYEGFVGQNLNFKCNTTGPGSQSGEAPEPEEGSVESLVDNSPFCEVEFVFQSQTPVNCKAWGCKYDVGGTDVKCSEMVCECEDDCPDALSSIVQAITAVDFTCDGGSGDCAMLFGGALPVEVKAPCQVRECFDGNGPIRLTNGLKDEGFKFNWNVLIISLPPVLVILFAVALGIPSRKLAKQIQWQPVAVGPGSHRRMTKAVINEIKFHGLGCSVPLVGESDMTVLTKAPPSDLEDPAKESPVARSFTLAGLDPGLFELMDSRRHHKSILHGLSGTFKKGDLVGVMGPSGGGKSTFLSIISNMSSDSATKRVVNGSILVDGQPQGSWTKRLSAFVPQEDKLLPTLTVRESLMYSAVLRLPGASMDSIYRRTDEVLHELSLAAVSGSLVGGVRTMRGISGGERRRVTIGMELITDPGLVIMDEPLSGLDSYTAQNLMHTLKDISSAGRLVVLSLHQPTPAMLNLLDQLLLLAKGFQVYLGRPQDAAGYFAELGYHCPESIHIAEYMLQAISNQATLVPLLNSVYRASLAPALEQNEAGNTVHPEVTLGHPVEKQKQLFRKRSQLKNLLVLYWRGFYDIVRNPSLLLAHVTMASVVGVICGVVFYDAKFDINGAQNRLGGIFFSLAFLAFSSLTTIDLLHTERGIVMREIKGGYYNSVVYVLSKVLLDAILLRIIPAILLGTPVYLMMGMQRKLNNFLIFIFGLCTFNLVIGAMSMAITLVSISPGMASLCINTYLLFSLLMMGHLVHLPSIPAVIRWTHYISPFSYAFQALAVSEMASLKLTFDVAGYATVDGVSGEVFLRTIGLEKDELRRNLWALDVFYVCAVLIVFLGIYIGMNERRRQAFYEYARRRFRVPLILVV